jgi:hypothetical protein
VRGLPKTNATLLKVTGPGYAADDDVPAAPGTVIWQGTARVYVREEVAVPPGSDTLNVFKRMIVTLPRITGLEVDTGDVMTVRYRGAEQDRKVRDVQTVSLPGILHETRVEVDPQ